MKNKMMKWIPALLLLLNACNNAVGPQKIYYQLPEIADLGASTQLIERGDRKSCARKLWVQVVNVSEHLNGVGIVYQTNQVRHVMAQQHLWMSSLSLQLQEALVRDLSNALPGWMVSSKLLFPADNILVVNVSGFHGRYDGKVIINGNWIVKNGTRWLQQPFKLELAQPENGYDALVQTLAQGWQKVAYSMAEGIEQLQGQFSVLNNTYRGDALIDSQHLLFNSTIKKPTLGEKGKT